MSDTTTEPGSALVLAGTDVPTALEQQMRLADVLSAAGTLPAHLRGKPANVLSVMIAARSLNIPMWQAFQHMVPIEGKMSMSADLQRAIVTRHGCIVETVENTFEQATVTLERPDQPGRKHSFTYTKRDAEIAGLLTKDNWKHNPRAMLVARATTTVLRQNASDLLLGFAYTPDELRENAVIDVTDTAVVRDAAPRAMTADEQHEWRLRVHDAETEEALRAVWDAAVKEGVQMAHLDGVDGEPATTVKALVNAKLAELRAAAAPEQEQTPAAEDVVDGEVVEDEFPDEAPPAPEQRMACGCDPDVVFQTGHHEPGCTEATR